MRKTGEVTLQPYISVVIPTYNRPVRLGDCVTSLSQISYPKERFEVIVVDDGSPQPIQPVLEPFASSLNLKMICKQRGGPAVARNTGLKAADGELVAFTDDDCRPRQDWLAALAAGHAQDPAAALGGTVHNAITNSICAETSQLLIEFLYEYYDSATTGRGFFTSNNLAFPAAALRELGGFSEKFPLAAGEDREICDRWSRSGNRLRHLPEAVIDHYHNLNPKRFLRQHFNYGRGAWRFRQKLAQDSGERVRIEKWQFYSGLLSYPFGKQPMPRAVACAGLLALAQAANASGFLYEMSASRSDSPSH